MFIEDYDIEKMQPADYNPRKITDEAFEKLKESLNLFGVVKPVLINKNGILVAGHQRTKAMKAVGIKKVPVFILKNNIAVHDEIKFNLMHNSIENETAKIKINNADKLKYGFSFVDCSQILVLRKAKGVYSFESSKLLNRYGSYGSVVINEQGEVIHNADYAFVTKLLNKELLVYKMDNKTATKFSNYISLDYGSYNYEALNIKPYVQTHCQMNRNGSSVKSTTYERLVIPNIKKEERGIDFGAGKCFYPKKLKNKGYKIWFYEPFFKKKGTLLLDITSTVKMINDIKKEIKENSIFDYVVLDSVLNSVSSNEYEDAILTTCNALLSDEGIFYTGTRNLEKHEVAARQERCTTKNRWIEFVDKDNYSATFRNGVWTLQKLHTVESLNELLKKYFEEVEIYDSNGGSQIWAKCKKPIRFSKEKYEKALNAEFNIEYPKNYRHNMHTDLVNEILKRLFS